MIDAQASKIGDRQRKCSLKLLDEHVKRMQDDAWLLGSRYYAADLQLLKTIKAYASDGELTDFQFREFVRSSTN